MSGIPGLFALAQPATTEGTPAAQLAAARQKLFTADGTDPSALAALWCVGVYDVSVYAHQALAKKGLLSLPARYMLAYSSTPEGLQRCEALYVQVHDVAMATTAKGTGTSPPPSPPTHTHTCHWQKSRATRTSYQGASTAAETRGGPHCENVRQA